MSQFLELDPRKLAAIVYDDGVAIDALLRALAADLARRGVRIGGVIQRSRLEAGCGPKAPMALEDVATGETFPICQVLGPSAQGCSFDPSRLFEGRTRVRRAVEAGAELVFVSRFGKEEARGRGFCPELAEAILSGCPVLTAVARGRADNWFAFTGGIGTLLESRLWVLERWWAEIARAPVKAA